jgi:feruloyl esterase
MSTTIRLWAGAATTSVFALQLIAASCESLSSLILPDTTIRLAQSVAAGAFILPGSPIQSSPGTPAPFSNATFPPGAASKDIASKDLPAFCRVVASIKPSPDSDIKVEVWMPVSGWNHKLMGVGNGGWAGAPSYPLMRPALARGYATASTDTGH